MYLYLPVKPGSFMNVICKSVDQLLCICYIAKMATSKDEQFVRLQQAVTTPWASPSQLCHHDIPSAHI